MFYEYLVIIILSIGIFYFLYRDHKVSLHVQEIKNFLRELPVNNFNRILFLKTRTYLDEIIHELNYLVEIIKEKLKAANEERERMEAILRGMIDGILIVDASGKILLANRPFRKIFNVDKSIENKQFFEVIRNMHLIDIFRRALQTSEIVTEEIMVSRTDRDVYLVATGVPVYSEGSVSGIVLTLHDITRLKQLERIRTDFVANVSHEIKTPLTAIIGYAETLLEGALEDRENAVKFLEMIRNHSQRLNSLVDDLLTLSRIELGDIKVEKTLIDHHEVIDTVIATFKERAQKKGLYLKKIVNDSASILADKDRLIQILLNLVDNAIKFTEKGGVTVSITTSENETIISVEDTGIGIPSSHLSRIGERFYRVDKARSRELGGTGLGLAIVKHLVRAHGWDMKIESIYEKGTKVSILIREC